MERRERAKEQCAGNEKLQERITRESMQLAGYQEAENRRAKWSQDKQKEEKLLSYLEEPERHRSRNERNWNSAGRRFLRFRIRKRQEHRC